MWRSFARAWVLTVFLLAGSLAAGKDSTAGGLETKERELMAELQELIAASYGTERVPGTILRAAVRVRQIRAQADELSPDTPSELSRRAMVSSFKMHLDALGEMTSETAGPRTKLVGDPARMAEITVAWNALVNDILAYLKRWPEYWQSPLTVGANELFLPQLLISICQTERLSGDNWEMPRIADDRQATLPESLVSCCLNNAVCRRIWETADCGLGLTVEMATAVERDALLGYRFAHEYWNRVRAGAATDPRTSVAIATKTIKMLAEMFGPAVEYPRGNQHAGTPLPEAGVVEWLRSHGSLWPLDGNPFTTVPGLRNPRIGFDGIITCDIIVDRACRDALPERTVADFKYYLGNGYEVLVE